MLGNVGIRGGARRWPRPAVLLTLALSFASQARAQGPHSIQFDGTNDYVTFGQAPSLGASIFTVEVRFKRTGTGITANTGTGGLDAVPLLTKGRGEADGGTQDANYFLGIRPTDNVLVADYEEGTGQSSPGANHPIAGTTAITSNVWHHGAVTFDGTTLRLYLDGNLEKTVSLGSGHLPQSASIQHAALGSAINSTGAAQGFFAGLLDEGRIWNVARSQAQIQSSMASEVLSGSGLIGRWGLNEGTGSTAGNSISASPQGTLTGGPLWSSDSPLSLSGATSLRFGGANGYVTLGDPAALRLGQFTLETWFRKDGAGVTTSTGAGGVTDIIPLIAKGRNEGESATVDVNYILGIRASDGVVCADFEEGAGGASPSLNHPIFGVTPISNGVWHHAAATYDGSKWQLFLDGGLENELVVGRPPASSSNEQVAIGSALTAAGAAAGFFNGAIDEARIWSTARTQAEVDASMNMEISSPATGLVGRWGLNEDSGFTIASSAGTTMNGTITGSDWSWAAGSPFNAAPPSAPSAPSDLAALAIAQDQIFLSWTDVATNETSYEIERSTSGSGGPFNPLITLPANSTSHVDGGLTSGNSYCYRVRAVNNMGASAYDGPSCATALAPPNKALGSEFDAYVDFGNPASLRLSQWTIEMWLRRDGNGFEPAESSDGLQNVAPLFTKGRHEGEGGTVDINYYFGVRRSDGVLAVEFEESPTGASPSANHWLYGVTPMGIGPWYHVATTYDGTTLRLYLNGFLESSLNVGRPAATTCAASAALMTALDTAGSPDGQYIGPVDEVRVWNVARSAAQILATVNTQITSAQSGLVARWSLDEGSGLNVAGTAGTAIPGSIHGGYYLWQDGAPFTAITNRPPLEPSLVGPADRANGVSTSPNLRVSINDPEAAPMTVTWYGRVISPSPASEFMLIGLPDTQYYAAELDGNNAMFRAQTDWAASHRAAYNIAYVGHYGDCVESGDNNGDPIEWMRADTAMTNLENPVTTGLTYGIPYGVAVGNHDQSPNGDADGSTSFYNQYFGSARFAGRPYYGGHWDNNNDNHYQLFSASGMDFIVISPEFDTNPNPAVLAWMDALLTTYANRRAIIISHYITNSGNPSTFSGQGKAIYEALKDHPNLFLMLSGHIDGEGRRQDTFNGNTVYSLQTDYQWHANGGDGFMRLMQFSPANNSIRVRSYSPYLDQYKVSPDSVSQFTISYDMTAGPAFEVLGSQGGVTSGTTATLPWSGLYGGRTYEWYATLSDGTTTTRGPFWRFTTTGTVGVEDGGHGTFDLAPIRPNPMRGGGQITFTVPSRSPLRLSVFDVQGREVARLADGRHEPGRYSVEWDGASLQSGIYFVRLDAPGVHLARRLVLMR
jgi:hypothetical protein